MNINDLETVSQLVEKRKGIIFLIGQLDAGEAIKLTIGSTDVPISRPELIDAARYQLKVHFEQELQLTNDALTALDVIISDD